MIIIIINFETKTEKLQRIINPTSIFSGPFGIPYATRN